MNKQTLITVTILALLFIGTSFYNSNYGIGRYTFLRIDNGSDVLLDTKKGVLYYTHWNNDVLVEIEDLTEQQRETKKFKTKNE